MIQTVPQKEEKFTDLILPESYIQYSPVNADITGFSGSRLIIFDRQWLRSTDAVIRQRYPREADSIWHMTGLEWGRHSYGLIEKLAKIVFPNLTHIQDLGMEQFQNLFTNHMAMYGWGNFELKRRDQFLFVDLYDSLAVDCLKDHASVIQATQKTLCFLYAGFFAGIFSSLSKMDLGCIEITCQVCGYEHCSFLLDNQDTIAMVERSVQKGLSPLDSFELLKKELSA